MSPLVYLKFQTQVMQIWFLNCRNYQIFTFVKDEGFNLQTCASALISIVSVIIWGYWNHLMALVLDMYFQRYGTILLR
jgi:hypothetical protein